MRRYSCYSKQIFITSLIALDRADASQLISVNDDNYDDGDDYDNDNNYYHDDNDDEDDDDDTDNDDDDDDDNHDMMMIIIIIMRINRKEIMLIGMMGHLVLISSVFILKII